MLGKQKIVIYSHDAMGLGHMRRSVLIAQGLVARVPSASVLLISGAPELGAFPLPERVDAVTLPPFTKTSGSSYVPRNSAVSAPELLRFRSRVIRTALESFDPDLLLVDKVPRGLRGELDETLLNLRRSGTPRVVLGLRDVLDDPLSVQREWQRDGFERAVCENYDEIWVYGDPAVYDLRDEYSLSPEIRSKVRFTGYLNPLARLTTDDALSRPVVDVDNGGGYALCTVGGGQDGGSLARVFLAAPRPPALMGEVLCGPYMPKEDQETLLRLADGDPGTRVLGFVADPGPLLRNAERIVTMGGYNALTEAVALGIPTLVVPRVSPRTEQLVRARRFADLGLVDALHPRRATKEAIGEWLSRPVDRRPANGPVDFEGLERIPLFIEEVLNGHPLNSPLPATGESSP